MQQRSIASFFGGGGAKPAAQTAAAAKAGGGGGSGGGKGGKGSKENKASGAATAAGDQQRLKRLKRTAAAADAAPSARPAAEAALEDEMEDEVPTTTAAAAAAAAPAADTPAGAPATSPPAKAAAASAGAAGEHSGSDEDMEDEDDEEIEDEEDEEEEEAASQNKKKATPAAAAKAKKKPAAASPSPSPAAKKKPAAAKKAAGASKTKAGASAVEGVGAGALEAAARHAAADVASLVTWRPGAPVPYALLVDTFEAIASTTKRLEIVHALTTCFRAVLSATPGDLLPTVYLCVNRVAPAHEGVELGVGEAALVKALAQSTGRTEAVIRREYEAEGDLGVVAVRSRATQRTMFPAPPLTVPGVFKTLKEIAAASGAASQARKAGMIVKLLAASKGSEAGYVMRSLQAKLRIGLAEQSVLAALAHAVLLHTKEAAAGGGGEGGGKGKGAAAAALSVKGGGTALADELEAAAQAVKQAYSECPSYDVLVPALLAHPLSELPEHAHFMPGVPVKPMLAKPTNGVSEVLDKFGDIAFTCEYKYDGERAQIHVLPGGRVRVFSRNAEDMTAKYPDIVARVPSWLAPGTESVVIDGEAVAWDAQAGRILPFQVLSTRARKDVTVESVKVQVMVFAFDCLYLNSEALLMQPLTERRAAMARALRPAAGEFAFATARTSSNVEELEAFLNEAVEGSTEGLIVKTLDDTYEPSKRSSHWLKLKKDYMDGVGDTFDVVPIGGFYGRGKRTGVYGAFLLAVYDDAGEAYQAISKLGTGFSEEQLSSLAESLRPHVLPAPRAYYQVGDGAAPDVWFDAVQVWEVKAADLSISPVAQAAMGLVEPGKGVSIRFPRLIRVRDDKAPEDATTAAQVADMYRQQAVVQQRNRAAARDDDAAAAGDDE